jgi:taurine transport system substrate-binding protein
LKFWTSHARTAIMAPTAGGRPDQGAGRRRACSAAWRTITIREISMQQAFVLGAALALSLTAAGANAQTVTVGYQLIYNPWKVPIADDKFSEVTGWDIEYRRFDSGAKVITAMASGDVQIALAGSSPIAAGVSQGVDMQLVWIVEDIADAEALVVRNGSGIDVGDPKTLEGKKLGVPFVSTTHFHTMFALETWGIDPNDVEILNLQPPQIAAAWERGDIDAAFVWDPALGQIKQSGEVMITSGELSEKGKATFDGLVVNKTWAAENAEGLAKFIKTIAEADADYRDNKDAWTADSEEVQKIIGVVGGTAADVPVVLDLYEFPTLEEQVNVWLNGDDPRAVKALAETSKFLVDQGKIPQALDDYSGAVSAEYARMALELQ